MGASSVLGTAAGAGAAFPGQAGPGNNRNMFQPIVSSNVVAAGLVSGSTAYTITVSGLSLPSTSYVVMAQSQAGANAVTIAKDTAAAFGSFALGAAGVGSVGWTVVKP